MTLPMLWVFLLSMVPVLELRFAIPFGCFSQKLPFVLNYLSAVVGNLVPVPFILLYIPRILAFMNHHNILPKITGWLERKAQRGAEKLQASAEKKGDETKKIPWGACLALLTFVALPLPGTGAWTGALVAAFFGMKKRYAIPAIAVGVISAGVLVSLITYGFLPALNFLIK